VCGIEAVHRHLRNSPMLLGHLAGPFRQGRGLLTFELFEDKPSGANWDENVRRGGVGTFPKALPATGGGLLGGGGGGGGWGGGGGGGGGVVKTYRVSSRVVPRLLRARKDRTDERIADVGAAR